MTVHTNQASVTISASTTTASGALPADNKKGFIRVHNAAAAPVIAYVTTGEGAATATATGQFVAAGDTVVMEKPVHHDYVAVILSASTGNVVVAPCGNP